MTCLVVSLLFEAVSAQFLDAYHVHLTHRSLESKCGGPHNLRHLLLTTDVHTAAVLGRVRPGERQFSFVKPCPKIHVPQYNVLKLVAVMNAFETGGLLTV